MKGLLYKEFFGICMNEIKDRKTSFTITTDGDCFIACSKDFLKTINKIAGHKKFKLLLLSNCFCASDGFDFDSEDNESSCVNTNFDEQNIIIFASVLKKLFSIVLLRNYIISLVLISFRSKKDGSFAFVAAFLTITFT